MKEDPPNSNLKKKKVRVYTKKKHNKSKEDNIIKNLEEKYEQIIVDNVHTFNDLPLSNMTLEGLKHAGYNTPTEIQRDTIKESLQGRDILGAAQTGSGKTLAFLIPLLEVLYREKWSKVDGVGAIVITPTRELAYQIFETLRKIGQLHDFSAGLIIGGKDLKFERNRMDKCNIIICTPGRLLQHMDENPLFNCENMKILVLDEADRCLDMGFARDMNAIIANLPLERQTLLFSATQTKSVKDLARLSLKDPKYIDVHENKEFGTPNELQQLYVMCELKEKVSILWSFIKNNLKRKMIVFFASCKEAKYMFEIFSKLRPGVTLMSLYGTKHQLQRLKIYDSFDRKENAVLFATDLAARGLDFAKVHWVVQADCPEDAKLYIHRVGRTARNHCIGNSLLLLLPSEKLFLEELQKNKIPIEHMLIPEEKIRNPIRKIEAFLAKNVDLKESAQRAFKSYFKTVSLLKNKEVFKVQELDPESFALSLGLAIPPRIRFLERSAKKKVPKVEELPNTKIKFEDDSNESNDSGVDESGKVEKSAAFSIDEDSDNDLLTIKRKDHDIELPTAEMNEVTQNVKNKKAVTRAAIAKKLIKKNIVPNKKITFNDEGEAVPQGTKFKQSELAQKYENEASGGINIETAKLMLQEEDKFDKQLFKEKIKAKHKEEKRKLKEKKRGVQEEEERDEFGTDSEEEEPDLGWLPDPDKVYRNANSDDENVKDNSEEDIEEENSKPVKKSKKRKMKNIKPVKNSSTQKKKKLKLDNLNVLETEELAKMLLTA